MPTGAAAAVVVDVVGEQPEPSISNFISQIDKLLEILDVEILLDIELTIEFLDGESIVI